MFQSILTMQAQFIRSATELTMANISQSMDTANKMMQANLDMAGSITGGASKPKKTKAEPASSFFPTPFNYFPNIMKKETVFPFPTSPAEFMKPFGQPVSGVAPFAAFMPSFAQAQSSVPSPFGFDEGVKAMQQMWPQASNNTNIKGMMVYFEIPLESIQSAMKASNFPFFNVK